MNIYKNNNEYKSIVAYIMNNEEFLKIESSNHHGTSRLEHSVKVSYYSYLIAKKLNFDYEKTATAGLLHDYFITDNDKTIIDSIKMLFKHSKIASDNAVNQFNVSEKEKNIIETHMFPINIKPPRFKEGWLVSIVDKVVGSIEFGSKLKYNAYLWVLFLSNFTK